MKQAAMIVTLIAVFATAYQPTATLGALPIPPAIQPAAAAPEADTPTAVSQEPNDQTRQATTNVGKTGWGKKGERKQNRQAARRAARQTERPEPPKPVEHDLNTPDGMLTPYGVAYFLHAAGFTGEELVQITATCIGESLHSTNPLLANPAVHGDKSIANSKWGHSIGLCQIRSLHADTGTGRPRDARQLENPAANAKAAWAVAAEAERMWGHDQRLRPWTVYWNGGRPWAGKWRQFEDAARDAALQVAATNGL